jgi:hypothetical protein
MLEILPALVVLLTAIGSAIGVVLKLVVERTIASSFDTHAKALQLQMQRRAAFEDQVLADRFALVTTFAARLERVATNLNRIQAGQPAPDGFMREGEIVPLTEIFEDLEIQRLVLGEEFYDPFARQAQLAWRIANTQDPQEREQCGAAWVQLREEIRSAAEEVFAITRIRPPQIP